MNKIKLTLGLLLLSTLLLSFVGIMWNPEYAPLCLVSAVMLLLLGIGLTFCFLNKLEKGRLNDNEMYKKTCDTLRSNLEKSEELRQRYRETLEKENAARKEAENKCAEAENELNSIRAEAASSRMLEDFKKNVSTPYFELLKSVELPLSDSDRQRVLDRTVDVAMLAIDMADANKWTINNREEQRISLELISGAVSRKDALLKAIAITDNPALTPKWARVLKQALDNVVSKDNDVIYSGYKMQTDDKE